MESEKKQVKIEDGSSDDGWSDSSSESDSIPKLELSPSPLRPCSGDPGRISKHLLSVASSIVGNLNQGHQSKPKEQASGCPSVDMSSLPIAPPLPPDSYKCVADSNPFFIFDVPNPSTPSTCDQGSSTCGVGSSSACGQGSSSACGQGSSSACGVGSSSVCGQGSSSACGQDSSSACGPSSSSLTDLFGVSNSNISDILKDDHLVATMMASLTDCVASSDGIADATTRAYVFVDKLFCCYKVMAALECSKNKDNALFTFAFKSFDKSICEQFKNALTQLSSGSQDYSD